MPRRCSPQPRQRRLRDTISACTSNTTFPRPGPEVFVVSATIVARGGTTEEAFGVPSVQFVSPAAATISPGVGTRRWQTRRHSARCHLGGPSIASGGPAQGFAVKQEPPAPGVLGCAEGRPRRMNPKGEPAGRTSSANQQGRSSRTNQKERRWRLWLVARGSGATLASANAGRGTRQRRGTQPRGSVRSNRALGFASDRGFLIRQGRKAYAIPSTIRRGLPSLR